MVAYSLRHDAMYDAMISEMLRFAGFQESVNVKLRRILIPDEREARWCDDLYEIYSGQQVIDDAD